MTPDQLVTYQWFADKTEIPDADGATLAVTDDMVGKKLSVKVTSLTGEVATSEATAAVAKDLPDLENVIQYSANEITLFFDADASSIDKDDIMVAREEDGLVNPVEKVELVDSTTIRATLSSPLIDETDYTVEVGDAVTSFTASVGEVASINIITRYVEVNKPTKIEYQLLDEKGIDVTSTQKLKETVLVEITGTYKAARTSDPTDLSVTMGAVDDECEVTITYNKGTGSDESVNPATGLITCVGPEATKGTVKYTRTDDVNANSNCARFYLENVGTPATVSLAVNDATEGLTYDDFTAKPLFFAAFDDNGAAIEYDQYEVESANEAFVAAKIRNNFDSGRFTVIDLVGNAPGATQLKVIATSNGVSKEYSIPVTVKKIEDMVKVVLSDSRSRKLSNAYDEDYYDTIEATIIDDNGEKGAFAETLKWELKDKDNYKEDTDAPTALQDTFDWVDAAGYNGALKAKVRAWGAKNGTYTVTATADIADVKKSQSISINVSKLPQKSWINADGQKLTYKVEKSDKMNNIAAKNDIKLYAEVNGGLFAGYVRQQAPTAQEVTAHGDALVNSTWTVTKPSYATKNGDKATATGVIATGAAVTTVANDAWAKGDGTKAQLATTIELWDGDPAVTGSKIYATKQLTRVTKEAFEAAATTTDKDALGEYGAYYLVEEGDAANNGEITIGWKDGFNGGATTGECDKEEGTVKASAPTQIAFGSVKWAIKFGNKQLATNQLYGFIENDSEATAFYGNKGITVYSDRIKAEEAGVNYLTYVAGEKAYDYDIARAGRYDIIFTYKLAQGVKKQTLENEFRVEDKVATYVPKVTLLTTTASSYDLDSFKDITELSVDLNNNNGLSESLVEPGLMKTWVPFGKNDSGIYGDIDDDFGGLQIDSDDTYARYAVVEETIGEQTAQTPVLFFVPVGKNIKED